MLILGLAVVIAFQTPAAVETYGRDVLTAGVCGSIGWVADTAEAGRLGESVMAAHPTLTLTQFEAAAANAGTLAGQEIQANLAAVTDLATFQIWATGMTERCDGIASRYPALLQRGPNTAEAWARTQTRLSAKYSQ
jgi:hypothetical protein